MKKLLFVLPVFILAQSSIPMPPAIPSLTPPPSKKVETKSKSACAEVPPMLVMLPPPLQNAVTKCENERYTPQNDKVIKVLSKYENKKIHIIKIKPVEGFVKVYQIKYKIDKGVKRIYCNSSLTKCFKGFVIK